MIAHGGGINGFRSHLAHYPKLELTIAVLTNLASGRPDAIEKQIAELFLDDEEEKEEPAAKLDVLIRGGSVVDGTGKPRFQADVGIRDGRIAHVGPAADATAELVIDAEGMIVAPGFLDAHNHSEFAIAAPQRRLNEGFVRQGVTTIVGGPDGGLEPNQMRRLIEAYEKNGVGTHVALYVGHNAIRRRVMRENPRRAPSHEELEEMKTLVREGMELGAVGLSTGLMYEPGMFSDTDEVVSLAAEAAPYGGIYDSHVRNPVHALLKSDREVIEIARRAHVGGKIGHLKAVGLQTEGLIRNVIELVEDARRGGLNIVSDQYPYDGAATLTLRAIIVVPPELRRSADFDLNKALDDPAQRSQIRQASENGISGGFAWLKATGYSSMRITRSDDFPELIGEYLSELAKKRDVEPFDLVAGLLIDAEKSIFITLGAIQEADVRELMVQPWNMIASDGAYADSSSRSANGHPRSTGTFPRVLGHYVRELHLLTLEEAVRKMTSLPADFLGLTQRGRIAEGMAADVVVFDADTIGDRSTWSAPGLLAEGVRDVLVAGVPVLKGGRLTDEAPGRYLRRRQ
jgi:N-acyl-D-aspartate/D-glutamate deacylase